ncbi:MAG: hypothetical protein HRT74_05835 [Flavobacteriales bacterium]|nr:hypothetical protein [Flavobacteriales bacterium]
MRKYLIILGALSVALFACKQDEPENPFEAVEPVVVDNPDINDIPVGNFAWLHGKVFKPTCANSGCHDGTFEPDFRTISSSYNSLVNQPVISNNAAMSFQVRVQPGNSTQSLLNERLTANIPNSSGIMPLEVDEESDWLEFEDQYIAQIQQWINDGAPDMFGNAPAALSDDLPPFVSGFVVFPEGNTTTPYIRDPEVPGLPPILVEATTIDVWMAVWDDITPAQDLLVNELRYAPLVSELENATPILFDTTQELWAQDFGGNPTVFYRKATIDLSGYSSGDTFFLRSSFSDGVNNTVDTPNEGSNPFFTAVFVIEIQ